VMTVLLPLFELQAGSDLHRTEARS
jgi:hypothetical protein